MQFSGLPYTIPQSAQISHLWLPQGSPTNTSEFAHVGLQYGTHDPSNYVIDVSSL